MPVKEKIRYLLLELNKGIYEKEEIMALALLSAIAGESVFLLGPPGVAKSLIARRLKHAFKAGRAFEYLMHRFSTPDEIFGPIDIVKLKDEGKYERLTDGYLPSAEVVFLDEIWKAGPAIQNTLLTVLNEKIFRNGTQVENIPLKALFSASNELPAKDQDQDQGQSQSLEALWDRFLLRLKVDNIEKRENFEGMIRETQDADDYAVEEEKKITLEEYAEWKKDLEKVAVPPNVLEVIDNIRGKIRAFHSPEEKENEEERIYVSDRRWRKIVRLLRTSAFLNDREEVDLMDCFLIRPCIWNDDGQIDTVHNIVVEAVESRGYTIDVDFMPLRKELKEFQEEIKNETTEKQPVLVKDEFTKKQQTTDVICYKFENEDYFIIKSDFDKAKNGDELYVYYGDYNQSLARQMTAIKKSDFSVSVGSRHNNGLHELETHYETRDKAYVKRIHKDLEKAFDERIARMEEYVTELEDNIKKHKNALEHLSKNLFVDSDLAEHPQRGILQNEAELKNLRIEIGETRNSYKNIPDAKK